jgi:hypothetical protein
MDLILYVLTFKVERCIRNFLTIIIKIKIYHKFKYIAQIIYNKKSLT